MTTIAIDGREEREMAAEMLSGSREAFAMLYHKYAAPLLGVIVSIVGDMKEAEAVLQKTFLEIWDRKSEYKQDISIFIWMFRLARKCAHAQLAEKTNITKSEIHNSLKIVNKDGFLNNGFTSADMEKTVFDLLYYKGFSLQDISASLDIPYDNIKMILRRAMKGYKTVQDG